MQCEDLFNGSMANITDWEEVPFLAGVYVKHVEKGNRKFLLRCNLEVGINYKQLKTCTTKMPILQARL